MKKSITIGLSLLLCLLATTASASTIGYELTITPSTGYDGCGVNVPTMSLKNISDSFEISEFTLSIGDTSYFYDFFWKASFDTENTYTSNSVGEGWSNNDNTYYGSSEQKIDFSFTGFGSSETFSFDVDIDHISGEWNQDYTKVLFDNDGEATTVENAYINVSFSNGYTFESALLDSGDTGFSWVVPGTNESGYSSYDSDQKEYFFSQSLAVPIPAAVWLFGSGLISLVGIRRKDLI